VIHIILRLPDGCLPITKLAMNYYRINVAEDIADEFRGYAKEIFGKDLVVEASDKSDGPDHLLSLLVGGGKELLERKDEYSAFAESIRLYLETAMNKLRGSVH